MALFWALTVLTSAVEYNHIPPDDLCIIEECFSLGVPTIVGGMDVEKQRIFDGVKGPVRRVLRFSPIAEICEGFSLLTSLNGVVAKKTCFCRG